MTYNRRWRLAMALFALCAMISCGNDRWFVESEREPFVSAALDLESCNLLATSEFTGLSKKGDADFEAAIRSGLIVPLSNGTTIEQGDALDFDNGYLTATVGTSAFYTSAQSNIWSSGFSAANCAHVSSILSSARTFPQKQYLYYLVVQNSNSLTHALLVSKENILTIYINAGLALNIGVPWLALAT